MDINEANELQTIRHSAAHILAQAVKRLYPETKLAIGPAIENGFYYDMDSPVVFTPETLETIEKEMQKIVKENLKIERFVLPRAEALELMKDEPYKTELINELPEGEEISFYKQGEFTDLCAGPHVSYTKKVKAFKKKLDYTEVGGGVLMGASKPVIKAHGSSNGKAFYNAIRQAKKCVDGKVIEEISRSLEAVKTKEESV